MLPGGPGAWSQKQAGKGSSPASASLDIQALALCERGVLGPCTSQLGSGGLRGESMASMWLWELEASRILEGLSLILTEVFRPKCDGSKGLVSSHRPPWWLPARSPSWGLALCHGG